MIVKTVRLKKPVFQQLIEYVQSDKGRGGDQGFEIHHNLNPTCDLAEQFERNDQYRKRRSGGVVSYHEILSFHANDRLHLTTVILEDLARKYIELRGSNALCYAAPHLSELHPHIHFVFSGNHYRSAKTLRLDHAAFRRIRREIEAYQVERYPELEHSIVYLKDRQRTKGASRKEKYPSDRAYQLSKRVGEGRPTRKDQLVNLVAGIYAKARDLQDFCQHLRNAGLQPYERRGSLTGIKDGNRKWRFRTLSVDLQPLFDLEAWHKDLARLRVSQRDIDRDMSRRRSRW